MRLARLYFTGLLKRVAAFSSDSLAVREIAESIGVCVGPQDNLAMALAAVAEGETITLLPGEHFLHGDLNIKRAVNINGFGEAVVRMKDGSFIISASDVRIYNIHFLDSATSPSATSLVSVTGDYCCLDDVRVTTPRLNGVYVSGSYCRVQCFRPTNGNHGATGADIYYANGAVYGTIVGARWSGSRQYSLSYRGIDNVSQAGNGVAAIVQVR